MENQFDLAYFSTLPREVQCIILGFSFDLQTLYALLDDNSSYQQLAQDCVKYLSPNEGEKLQDISVNLVTSLPHLISTKYPIRVDTYKQLLEVAKHPNLDFATFHVEKLSSLESFNHFLESSPGDIDETWYSQYHEYWFLPFFLEYLPHEKGCICPTTPDYKFEFVVNNKDQVTISQDLLDISSFTTANNIIPLFTSFPICHYQGPISSRIRDKFLLFPCLKHITTHWEYLTIDDYLYYLANGIQVNSIGIKADWYNNKLSKVYFDRLDSFFGITQQYPKITNFLPITFKYLTKIKKAFPNLRNIRLLLRPNEKIIWKELSNYQRIILYPQKGDRIKIPLKFKEKVRVA